MTRKALRGLTTIVVLFGLLLAAPRAASAELVDNSSGPIDFVQFIPCANGEAGEEVHFTGTIHFVYAVTTQPDGSVSYIFAGNTQGLSGVGLTTGTLYHGVDRFSQTLYTEYPPETLTSISTVVLAGQGPGNDVRLNFAYHYTVAPDGELVVSVVNETGGCG
ncbi:hypothetical protein [Micromonospora sp. NPDC051006]|uniref:hypothetical protein n=1 Tax=Micromonospora sp. NPDC051006 TaxID=3364283 RepID=UPI0037BDE5B7